MRSLFISFALCLSTAVAQNSSTTTSGPNGFTGSFTFNAPPPFAARAVTGAPYSADQVDQNIQTLADGTHITHESTPTRIYRDSFGRTRTERPLFGSNVMRAKAVPDSPILVEINDPVAQVKYILDPNQKTAHRQQLPSSADKTGRMLFTSGGTAQTGGVIGGSISATPAIGAVPPPPPPRPLRSDIPRPQMANEKIGADTIEGVLAEGTRFTSTWPVGSQGTTDP